MKTTVKKQTLNAYLAIPSTTFYMWELIAVTKQMLPSRYRYTFDDTIRRKLYVLKQEGMINFACIDKRKSFYKKLNL